jgi:hypothetical protein
VDALGLSGRKRLGSGIRNPRIRRGAAVVEEECSARPKRIEQAGVAAAVDAARRREFVECATPAGQPRVHVSVGSKRRDDVAGEGRIIAQRPVRGEIVGRIIGRRQHPDAEPVEQGARPERVGRERGGKLVENRIRRRR